MENKAQNKAEKGPKAKEETPEERANRIRDGRKIEPGGPAKLGADTKEKGE